jgi:hypothetical protein
MSRSRSTRRGSASKSRRTNRWATTDGCSCLPDNREFCVNLDAAKNEEQRALIGRQAADLPLFSINTDDCRREYEAMRARGVAFEGEPETHPCGTGVPLRDLYGNRIYLNQD